MHTILIVDFSSYRNDLASIFSSRGYQVEISESAFEAITRLQGTEIDLVISEVELPGDNSFDLYSYVRDHYPYIPMIMITGRDIDNFFDTIFREGIGNVLAKPVDPDDLVTLSEKLITGENIFGLKNYITGAATRKRIVITTSNQIPKAVPLIISELESAGFSLPNKTVLTLVLHEMIINAVYHSHGLTRAKEARETVKLGPGQHVDVSYAFTGSQYGIAITDFNGKLTKERILESIHKVVEQSRLILESFETGEDISHLISETGRGIDLVRKLGGTYYFVIRKDSRTEIILIFDRDNDERVNEGQTALRIIEDFSSLRD